MGVQGPFCSLRLKTELLPADLPTMFWESNRVSKIHSAGTERGRVREDKEQGRVDRGMRAMRLRGKGCHPGSGSVHCSRREPAGGTFLVPEAGSQRDLPPSLELRIREGPKPSGGSWLLLTCPHQFRKRIGDRWPWSQSQTLIRSPQFPPLQSEDEEGIHVLEQCEYTCTDWCVG